MRRKSSFMLVTVLMLFACIPRANAGVRVAMADNLEKNRNFLVVTDIYYRKPEGQHQVKHIDKSFLTAGGTKHVTILAVWPLLYSHIYTYAMHPAFITDSVKSDKAPFVLRTIDLPALRPQSWRRLLDSGEAPKNLCGSFIPAIVDRHFHWILEHYLPAFDRARIKEDLRQYLPLLRELAAFADREKLFRKSAPGTTPGRGPMEIQGQSEPQAAVLEHYRREMERSLEEITAWMALGQDRRAPMHDWMENFQKGDYVFREMMNDSDRTRLLHWLDRCTEGAAEQTLQWTGQASGLLYTVRLTGRSSSSQGIGWNVDITADLNPILGLRSNRRHLQQSHSTFYRNADGTWNVKQLGGRR